MIPGTNNKYLSTLQVLEREAVDQIKNHVNACAYREAKDVLTSAGVPEEAANRLAARITLRMKRSIQDV